MNLTESLRMLMRRWYIFFPAILLTMALAIAVFFVVRPTYERAASVLLLPDSASIPEGGNPYLFMSGLSGVADVVVRGSNDQTFHDGMAEAHPGVAVTIARDTTTASPVIAILVESADDTVAGGVLDTTVEHVVAVLDDLQESEGIPAEARISSVLLVADGSGTVVQKTRLLATGAVAAVGVLFSILITAAVQGMSTRRRRRGGQPVENRSERPDDGVPPDESSVPNATVDDVPDATGDDVPGTTGDDAPGTTGDDEPAPRPATQGAVRT